MHPPTCLAPSYPCAILPRQDPVCHAIAMVFNICSKRASQILLSQFCVIVVPRSLMKPVTTCSHSHMGKCPCSLLHLEKTPLHVSHDAIYYTTSSLPLQLTMVLPDFQSQNLDLILQLLFTSQSIEFKMFPYGFCWCYILDKYITNICWHCSIDRLILC